MSEPANSKRVAFSPGEFAALFGKSQTWGYRQIYAGKVKAIDDYGRILIPANEVERLLKSAGIYNGKEKPKQQKARLSKLPEEQRSVWQRFIQQRKGTTAVGSAKVGNDKRVPGPVNRKPKSRSAETERIAKAWRRSSAGR